MAQRLVNTEHGYQLVPAHRARPETRQPKSGRGRGVCSCGWRGAWRINPNEGYAAADAHLDRMVKQGRYGWERHDIDVEVAR